MSKANSKKKTPSSSTGKIQRIMVAVDGSAYSERAFDTALDQAEKFRAQLYIVNVLPSMTMMGSFAGRAPMPQSTYEGIEESNTKIARTIVDDLVAKASSRGVKVRAEILRSTGSIVEGIVAAAEKEKVQLIVIGTRGLGGFKKLLLGSVSNGVVNHAECSVLVVR